MTIFINSTLKLLLDIVIREEEEYDGWKENATYYLCKTQWCDDKMTILIGTIRCPCSENQEFYS